MVALKESSRRGVICVNVFISKTCFLIRKMNTSFIFRQTIVFPFCTNDYLGFPMGKRLPFPYVKITILVTFQFEKDCGSGKNSWKSGKWEIWKSADSEIPDFSIYNYNRKFWICNTPPLIFPRNPAEKPMGVLQIQIFLL